MRFFARDWARRSEPVAELRVRFTPYDWDTSSVVQVVASGIRTTFTSDTLKTDPVGATTVHVTTGSLGHTGDPLTVLTIAAVSASLGVILVRSTDTKGDRARWRVRDEHTGDLGDFRFLATGTRVGEVPLRA
jgi:hypothetical protein